MRRRRFIQSVAGVAVLGHLGDWHKERLQESGLTPKPTKGEPLPTVAVAKGTDLDSAQRILKTALDALGGIGRFVRPGQIVAIKPNASWAYPPGTASSTDPGVLRALILMVKEAGAQRILVMDHCALDPGTAECLQVSGIGAVVDELGVEKVFPDRYVSPRTLFVRIDLAKAKVFQKLGVIKAAVEADVRINLAVAKSHLATRATMCLKHMMGFLQWPDSLHAQLDQGIADLNSPSPIQAQLHILEAIRVRLPGGGRRQAGGKETEITHPDKIKRLNEIVAGTDPVLMDAFGCLNYFSLAPKHLAHLNRAFEMGLGEMDVEGAKREGRLAAVTCSPEIHPGEIRGEDPVRAPGSSSGAGRDRPGEIAGVRSPVHS